MALPSPATGSDPAHPHVQSVGGNLSVQGAPEARYVFFPAVRMAAPKPRRRGSLSKVTKVTRTGNCEGRSWSAVSILTVHHAASSHAVRTSRERGGAARRLGGGAGRRPKCPRGTSGTGGEGAWECQPTPRSSPSQLPPRENTRPALADATFYVKTPGFQMLPQMKNDLAR